jgi:hypothetical protein
LLDVLELFGLAELSWQNEGSTDDARPEYQRAELHLSRVEVLLSDPLGTVAQLYAWGEPTFDGIRLFDRLQVLLERIGVPAVFRREPDVALEIFLFTLRPKLDAVPPGLEATFALGIAEGERLELDTAAGWRIALSAQAALDSGLKVVVLPPASVAFHFAAALSGDASLELAREPEPPATRLLFGEASGTRFEASRIAAKLIAGARWDATAAEARGEIGFESRIEGGKFVLALGGADGFLKSLLPSDGIEVDADVGLGWSSARGFYFSGSAGLETTIGVHRSLGPFVLESFHAGVHADEGGIAVDITASGSGTLGPVTASIGRIGASGVLKFQRGNLGELDFGFGFKPPTTVALAVRSGPVNGGGFISFDPELGRYTGSLELTVFTVTVSATAIIDTKPDISFLIVISAQFSPIQLGFGFTLLGVGGLLGIHRTVATEALRAGLREHTLDHILFPQDPLAHADELVRDLSAVFPAQRGRHLFGPMVKIGWGTPALITGDLGIIIELPDPVRIVLLGQISALLPEPEAPIVELHLDVLGVIDLGQKLFSLDATLHDSRIAAFSLFGDMAMRLTWGSDPSFALSVGGLNPHFTPPPNFPTLRRLTVALGDGDNPRLSLQTYFAITSNTLQLGAHAELYAEKHGFNIYGWLGFDALFVFRPFSFIVDINAGVALRRKKSVIAGIRVAATLSGPSPWHAKGEACLSLLFFDICVGFDETWGAAQPQELPTADPWLDLSAAIRDSRNWSAALPPAAESVVTMRAPEGRSAPVLLDPVGGVAFREKVIPLNRHISKYGEARPVGPSEYRVTKVEAGGDPVDPFGTIDELFAPAQFQEMSDADKLSAPSFEPMVGGVTIDADAVSCGGAMGIDVVYQTKTIDEGIVGPPVVGPFPLAWQLALAETSVATRSSKTGLSAYAPALNAPPIVTRHEPRYVVASTSDLSIRSDIAPPLSKSAALLRLRAYLDANPGERDALQIIAEAG